MKTFGMPAGMWALFRRSFRDALVSVLGLDRVGADRIARSAKKRYREIIAGLPEFERGDRFKMRDLRPDEGTRAL